jgi:DNA-binding response OmpR family regulator
VLERWRAAGRAMPVLILTARDGWHEKVAGIDAGADDYLAKPFELPELLARVRSILRRRHWDRREEKHGGPRAVVTIGEVRVDFESHEVSVRGEPVKLTRLELDLLRYFVEHPGKVVSRQQLLEEVWKLHNYSTARTVDNFVSRLRRHLEPDPQNPTHIVSVRGAGYKFVP